MTDLVNLQILGGFQLTVDGEEFKAWRSRSMRWLLGILALHGGQAVDRSWLAGSLWPDSTEQQALANLRLNLSFLRSALGMHRAILVQTGHRLISLDSSKYCCDALQFSATASSTKPEELLACVNIYQGELLRGCELPWILAQRTQFEFDFIRCVQLLASVQIAQGHCAIAIPILDKGLRVDPYNEPLTQLLLECYVALGDNARAVVSFRQFRSRLLHDLNLDVSAKLIQIYSRARMNPGTANDVVAPTTSACEVPQFASFPQPIATIHGREQELAEICQLLRKSRLVTLTGSGGVGKTRLALEAAHQITTVMRTPVYFVELAPVTDRAHILAAIARALGLFDDHSDEREIRIKSVLRARETVLFLDNCEQVIDDAADVVKSLLADLPLLKVITTSRRPLAIVEEWKLNVGPLSLPSECASNLESTMRSSAAVRLFNERAMMANSTFRATDENVQHIARICELLEGIPLALEMAAARAAHLSMVALESSLRTSKLTELDLQDNTRPMRHKTMAALIDWTYRLLGDDEQMLLGYLALFAGQFHLEHVANIAEEANIDHRATMRAFYSLTDWSLVRLIPGGPEATYVLQEPVKQYVRSVLADSPNYDGMNLRFLAVMHRFSEIALSQLHGPNQAIWLTRLETEHSNYLSLFAHEIARGLNELNRLLYLSEIAWNLLQFWEARGHLSFARVVLQAISQSDLANTRPESLLKANLGLLKIAIAQGEVEDAEILLARAYKGLTVLEADKYRPMLAYLSASRENLDRVQKMNLASDSLAVAHQAGDEFHAALSLSILAHESYRARMYDDAEAYLDDSWQLSQNTGDMRNIARILTIRGNLAWAKGQRSSAMTHYYAPALSTYRDLNDPRGIATSLMNIAAVNCEMGQFMLAEEGYIEAETLLKKLQRRNNSIYCKDIRACVKIAAGDYQTAKQMLEECLHEARILGDEILAADCLADLCHVSLVTGNLLFARRYCAALAAITSVDISWHRYRAEVDLALSELNAGNTVASISLFTEVIANRNVWNDARFNLSCYLNMALACVRLNDQQHLYDYLMQAHSLHWDPAPFDIGSHHDMFELLGSVFAATSDHMAAITMLTVADQLRQLAEIVQPVHLMREHDRLMNTAMESVDDICLREAVHLAEDVKLTNSDDIAVLFAAYLERLCTQSYALGHSLHET